jgi:hypothetical protein
VRTQFIEGYSVSFFLRWFSNPQLSDPVEKRNFINVQVDAVGVGLASAAATFLPVFLTRLGASNFQIGLLTSMPALTGLLLSIILGRFLQRQPKVVPWFSGARLGVIMCYALTGLVSMIVPENFRVVAVLLIWALATLPQTMLSITFSVVMNAIAGPKGRFELMSRRWSILGFTTSATVILIGQALDRLGFPFNYQVVFMGLSLGGLISYYFSSHIKLPSNDSIEAAPKKRFSLVEQYKEYMGVIRAEKPFISFVIKRFVFLSGTTLAIPLFPIYFVRVVKASDSWIAGITTAQTAVMILGYFIWTQQSRARGSRRVLLITTLGLSVYPAVVAVITQSWTIAIIAGISGIFQAGLDLVFFDELMNTIPPQFSATFVSFAQSLQYLSSIVAPLIGTYLADHISVSAALIIAGAVRLIGFLMFFFGKPVKKYAGL